MERSSLIIAVEDVLRQGLALLAQVDPSLYGTVAGFPFNASIGQHYRHVLDHFITLDVAQGSLIDYDNRQRDPQIESDVAFASVVTEELIHGFRDRKSVV